MAKPSTFRVLMVWIDGEEAFADVLLDEELLPEQVTALGHAGAARRKGFLLLARRNWQLEYRARRVRMPREVQGLFELPANEAVNRLLGTEDGGGHWHPGLAGLTAAEARVLEMRVIERRSVAEVGWALGMRDRTVENHRRSARRKLRTYFGLEVVACAPSGPVHRSVLTVQMPEMVQPYCPIRYLKPGNACPPLAQVAL